MLRTQSDAEAYIKHIVGVVQGAKQVSLVMKELRNEYEICCNEKNVWFGRDIDVDLIRTISATAFEDILYLRLERLAEMGLISFSQENVNE